MPAIYLDHAATSFPKAPGVGEAMADYMQHIGVNVNRGVYAPAQQAEQTVFAVREQLCRLFGLDDPARAILTPGLTWSMHLLLQGLLRPGDHCICSALEHNAVARPLQALMQNGVSVSILPCDAQGRVDIAALDGLLRPNTRALVLCHASNVCGTLQPARAVGQWCRAHGVFFLLDAAQTAGCVPIDFTDLSLSALCVPGHKGLLGPQGIGALLVTEELACALQPVVRGGTGSASDALDMPLFYPDRLEPGTPNLPGVYGLDAALSFIERTGVPALGAQQQALTQLFLQGVADAPVRLLGLPAGETERVGVVSLDFVRRDNAQAAFALSQTYGVFTRCGLHCAPMAHKALGTFPQGTVRFSFGYGNTPEQVQAAAQAVCALA